MLEEKFAF